MKKLFSNAKIVLFPLLEALDASADAFPPLKSAAGGALHIAKLVKEFRSNKKNWASFAEFVQENVAVVTQALANHQIEISAQLFHDGLEKLNITLEGIRMEIEELRGLRPCKRVKVFLKDPERIEDMKGRLREAMTLFQLKVDIQVSHDVSEILKELSKISQGVQNNAMILQGISEHQERMDAGMTHFLDSLEKKHLASLTELPYAQGASWSSTLACQKGTRISILSEIMNWIDNFQDRESSQIFFLTGVPGAGKTAISHSIAELCAGKGWLVTAFFFNRDDSIRASRLISTITRDLAARFPSFEEFILHTLKKEPSLSTATLTRQYHGLIRPFLAKFPEALPIVIVLDALDEGHSEELLKLLSEDFATLPKAFQFCITCRDIPEVQKLCQKPHVYKREFDHHGEIELDDIKAVAQVQLMRVAEDVGLDSRDWPSANVQEQFARESRGLMIWVVTICNYLRGRLEPQDDLQEILQRSTPNGHEGAESQIYNLYEVIMSKWRWDDKKFVSAYQLFMGTVLASKVPMSAIAIEAIHFKTKKSQIDMLVKHLKPLLVASEGNQPIQILHQSLHDFLTIQAHKKDRWKTFAIESTFHSQELALCCFKIMNAELSENTPGTGYVHGKIKGIPKISDFTISEHFAYSCKFWMDHLRDTTAPTPELNEAITLFMDDKFRLWLELTVYQGDLLNIGDLLTWIEKYLPQLKKKLCTEEYSNLFLSMMTRLHYEGQRQKAFEAASLGFLLMENMTPSQDETFCKHNAYAHRTMSVAHSMIGQREQALPLVIEAVDIYRKLAEQSPGKFENELAWCLDCLSDRLSSLGKREEALPPIKEAVGIYRKLVVQSPGVFDYEYAWCLSCMSGRLSSLGQRKGALLAIQKAVKIFRKLSEKNPKAFASDLACNLKNLSNRLSFLGEREEALLTIQEAVEIYRKLVSQNPKAFIDDLGWCLNHMSERLSSLGKREEALAVIKEAEDIFRTLAEQNPKAFIDDLAWCLSALSERLSLLGQREEALSPIKEAVEIYRKLADQSPDAFNNNLAWSLKTLSNRLSSLGQREEALPPVQEAVEIYKKLVAQNSKAFIDDLGWCLNHMSERLSSLGRSEEALAAIKEAEDIFRTLAEQNPKAFIADLAWCLSTLSDSLLSLGQREEALSPIKEAVEIYRKLADQSPEAFNDNLAWNLKSLSNRLSSLGKREEALPPIQEAVAIYRKLATQNPTAYIDELGWCLENMSERLLSLGQNLEALPLITEAVGIYRKLTDQNPKAFAVDLAWCLGIQSILSSDDGSALKSIRHALDIFRSLEEEYQDVFKGNIGWCLRHLSNHLSKLEKNEEALACIEESTMLFRWLFRKYPNAFKPSLARALQSQSDRHWRLGHIEEALPLIEESRVLCVQLVRRLPEAFNKDNAKTLNTLSCIQAALGLKNDALNSIKEAVSIYKALASKYPMAHMSDLVEAEKNMSLRQADLGYEGEENGHKEEQE
ncbi:hypothetical protein SCHPADRAFT_998957 [Schizopora paradoxa]|uniref:TPR-like protein n=1 Tax=Schizopora paradoxa TaxID=27342 RepID=A0A0H2RIH3_9AGAM|nr:hypothetical protein SCHPADRAFT_998957 [Schizopora paradoxa]